MTDINPETYVFDFGIYRGWKYHDIFMFEPEYIRWCDDSLDNFSLPAEERERVEERIKKRQYP